MERGSVAATNLARDKPTLTATPKSTAARAQEMLESNVFDVIRI